MIPEEAVEAAARALDPHTMDSAGLLSEKFKDATRAEALVALEAAAPYMLAKLTAEVAYQKARAAYFKYVPEIENDPDGVKQLVIEMRAARDRYLNIPPFSSP